MTKPIIARDLTTFQKEVLNRLDKIIKNQESAEKTAWAAVGVDIEHERYLAKYRELEKRARNHKVTNATFEELGIEVEQTGPKDA